MAANKCSLLTLAMLLTLASADPNELSTFIKVKEINTVITNEVVYTPPMVILGQKDGIIVRCPHDDPTSCEVYHSSNTAVTATLVHGEFLFAALESGAMLRCSWQRRHSCSVFNQADSKMTGLAVAAGFIYAGLMNGTILRCSLNTPHSCQSFAILERTVQSLAASNSFIYAGSTDSRIYRCDISANNCSFVCSYTEGAEVITGLTVLQDQVFGVTSSGFLLNYNDTSDACKKPIGLIGTNGYKDTAVYNGKIYSVKEDDPEIRIKVLGTSYPNGDTRFVRHNGAISISFAYGTHAMQDKYRMESTKCIWRGIFTCPPTVVYYTNLQLRAAMEVFVKDGKLFDSQGLVVDTSGADESYSQRAAIFVMGPDGQILLSNTHKRGLLHTSSLLAGNPVSGAGLMVVEKGKIISISACSIHYRPDQGLNEQVRIALEMKGYTDSIEFRSCTYQDTLCIQDGTNDQYFRQTVQ